MGKWRFKSLTGRSGGRGFGSSGRCTKTTRRSCSTSRPASPSTFPSRDDDAGGVDTYDVDLYLLDSGGDIVAESFNGGTNEFIDVNA